MLGPGSRSRVSSARIMAHLGLIRSRSKRIRDAFGSEFTFENKYILNHVFISQNFSELYVNWYSQISIVSQQQMHRKIETYLVNFEFSSVGQALHFDLALFVIRYY